MELYNFKISTILLFLECASTVGESSPFIPRTSKDDISKKKKECKT
jgi:hypothetical protein